MTTFLQGYMSQDLQYNQWSTNLPSLILLIHYQDGNGRTTISKDYSKTVLWGQYYSTSVISWQCREIGWVEVTVSENTTQHYLIMKGLLYRLWLRQQLHKCSHGTTRLSSPKPTCIKTTTSGNDYYGEMM